MRYRFTVWLTLLTAAVLFSSAALAGTNLRRVTLHDGTTITGTVIERGDGYLVIEREDGVAQELSREEISLVEVLTGTDEPQPDEDQESHWNGDEVDPEEQAQAIADRLSEASPSELRSRYQGATLAHGLAVAPTIPMMTSGLFIAMMLPIISSFEGDSQLGLGALGVLLTSSSIATAAAGSLLGRKAVGVDRSLVPVHLGMSFAIAGNLALNLSSAILNSYVQGELASEVLFFAAPPMLFTGMGFFIAGTVILMADAQISKDGIGEQIKRQRRKRRRSSASAPAPIFAGAWASPLPGGAAGGFSLRF